MEKVIKHGGAWDDDKVAKLKELIATGKYSASQIGQRLGVTRSQVLGKTHRMGLSIIGSEQRKAQWRSRKAKVIHAKRKLGQIPEKVAFRIAPPIVVEPLPACHVNDVARKALADLGEHECRFPVGDPGDPGFAFCAAGRVEGLPYCAEHAARCFVVPNNLKPRNKDTSSDVSADASRRVRDVSDLVSAGE